MVLLIPLTTRTAYLSTTILPLLCRKNGIDITALLRGFCPSHYLSLESALADSGSWHPTSLVCTNPALRVLEGEEEL